MVVTPKPGICDSCRYGGVISGGFVSIGSTTVPQRYCANPTFTVKNRPNIHFDSPKECAGYAEVEP